MAAAGDAEGKMREPNCLEKGLLMVRGITNFLTQDIPPHCGKPIRQYQVINLHKVLILPFSLTMMVLADDFSPLAWVYTMAHGMYGYAWVAKDVSFPDQSWRVRTSPLSALVGFGFLALYYLPILVMFTELGEIVPGGWGTTTDVQPFTLPLGLFCYVLGLYMLLVSDSQKYYTIKYKAERSLITEGAFATSRNPNYFGEYFLYLSFGIFSQHWLPFAGVGVMWFFVLIPNIVNKMVRMSRYEGWSEYVSKTGVFFPWIPTVIRGLPFIFYNHEEEVFEKAKVDLSVDTVASSDL
mmetsp:Transcript_19551/g.36120  ORF Transcript_19551/g.36120 Transcript_19551/m.36120 type:complete len:295 (+) Transcript_19551:132-1016(+)